MPRPAQTSPTALLAPTLDGEETSYFEWLGAGTVEVQEVAGAMHRTEPRAATLARVHFGFDHERLFVRIDGMRRLVDLLAEGRELSLMFLTPDGVRFSVRRKDGQVSGTIWDRRSFHRLDRASGWSAGSAGSEVAAGTVLEVALPLTTLGLAAGQAVSFFVAVYELGVEVERHPAYRPIELVSPDRRFGADQWRA